MIFPDADIDNADWTKQTRDVFDDEGNLVTGLDNLSQRLGIPKGKLKKLPVVTLVNEKKDDEII